MLESTETNSSPDFMFSILIFIILLFYSKLSINKDLFSIITVYQVMGLPEQL